MKKVVLNIDPFLNILSDDGFSNQRQEVDSGHRRMVRMLSKAIEGELTQRQQECVQMRYYEGKTVTEVARQLHIGVPTASKHLKKARKRLENVLRYSFPKLE